MKDNNNWSSPFFNSLWSDTTETFVEGEEDWKVVGTNPFKKRSKSISDVVKDSESKPTEFYYIVEFGSKRLDLGNMNTENLYKTGDYVILEADRGEDCGLIIHVTTRVDFEMLLTKYENIYNEIKPKTIYRKATQRDLNVLIHKKALEKDALLLCRTKIMDKGLKMSVVDCEYQWDLNKITFFYDSSDRIDFRELVKDIYKIYKKRIWMCSIEKSKNKYLRELVK